jgi:hypothetical protein
MSNGLLHWEEKSHPLKLSALFFIHCKCLNSNEAISPILYTSDAKVFYSCLWKALRFLRCWKKVCTNTLFEILRNGSIGDYFKVIFSSLFRTSLCWLLLLWFSDKSLYMGLRASYWCELSLSNVFCKKTYKNYIILLFIILLTFFKSENLSVLAEKKGWPNHINFYV